MDFFFNFVFRKSNDHQPQSSFGNQLSIKFVGIVVVVTREDMQQKILDGLAVGFLSFGLTSLAKEVNNLKNGEKMKSIHMWKNIYRCRTFVPLVCYLKTMNTNTKNTKTFYEKNKIKNEYLCY